MAELSEITIKDFKGISEVVVKPRHKGAPPVTTLIGLNESGKTTILEAISHFVTGDGSVSSLFDGIHSAAEVAALIPVNRKANFTGKITVSAKILLDGKDHTNLHSNAEENGFEIEPQSLPNAITATREYHYIDSAFTEKKNIWTGLKLRARRLKTKTFQDYKRPKDSGDFDLWGRVLDFV